MLNKELSELLDAISREIGEPMQPCRELVLLGFDPLGQCIEKQHTHFGSKPEEEEGVEYNDYNTDGDSPVDEEYEFDEDDEEYSLLTYALRMNIGCKKYFA